MSKVNSGLHCFKTKGGKSKRMRTSFTSEQLSRLEKEFARQQYMVGSERFLLASALHLTEAQVGPQFKSQTTDLRPRHTGTDSCPLPPSNLCLCLPGQSLVPEPTHQVAQAESGAAAGQTGQTGSGRSTTESRVPGQRGRRRRR